MNRESTIRIWKFPIRPDLLELRLPVNAEILCVGMQAGEPQMWVKLDTSQPLVSRRIYVYGTGQAVADIPQRYIGTFFLHDGVFVFHVFEEKSK